MLPPLHVEDAAPWKQRYRAPSILWTAIARNAPARGLVASNATGLCQLYTWDVPSGALTQMTHRPQGTVAGVLSSDGRYVYYLDDQAGNEIGHFVRVPFEGGESEDVTPDLPPYSSFSLTVSLDGRQLGCTLALSDGFHLYCMNLGPNGALGSPRDVFHGARMAFGPALSYDGGIAVLTSTERSGTPDCSLLAFNAATGERIAELWDGPESSVEAGAFSPLAGDDRLLATTNRSGVARPLVWNPRTGERIDLDLGDLSGEIHPLDWSPDAGRILLMGFDQAVQQLYVYDLKDGLVRRLAHPSGVIGGAYVAPSGEIYATWQDSTHPSLLVALDGKTGEQTGEVLVAGEVPPGHPWRSVTLTSADGQAIQGWLATPDGDGPFPTILETHGGPTAVQTEAFSPGSQAWLDHGFAFLSINYRGSTTFGRDFERKIWGDLGHWEVEDMVAARDWLIESGIARADQILLTGWSYGGYLTLQALGTYPDLWAGGMAGIAIADWAVQYEDSADTLRGYQAAIFGGTPTEKPEQYAASSPISYAERVRAPVLIIQGRNDTRTPARPIAMYEEKMRALGKAIEVHWFESGHLGAFADRALAIEHQELMLRFAYRVLGNTE